MSFVALGGDGSTRPTFFELVAVERLMPSLKAAAVYTLSVLAQRRPAFQRALAFEDELFALLTLLLDRHCLCTASATFADSLYGVRRAAAPAATSASPQGGAAAPGGLGGPSAGGIGSTGGFVGQQGMLSRRQQRLTLLFRVLLPYLRAKLDGLHARHVHEVEGVLGLSLAALRGRGPGPSGDSATTPPANTALRDRLRTAALHAFVRAYPWVHAGLEALAFSYQLAYLLDSTPYFSPGLHCLRQRLVRVTGQEMVAAERAKRERRRGQLARLRAPRGTWARACGEAWLRAGYTAADHTRNALILSVFAFKALEWWFTSGEEQLEASRKLPPPPPPPAPLPSPQGFPLPADPSLCPICRQARTNPATTTASGYMFCYPCLYAHVSRTGSCPVTCLPAEVDSIRRLYQSA